MTAMNISEATVTTVDRYGAANVPHGTRALPTESGVVATASAATSIVKAKRAENVSGPLAADIKPHQAESESAVHTDQRIAMTANVAAVRTPTHVRLPTVREAFFRRRSLPWRISHSELSTTRTARIPQKLAS